MYIKTHVARAAAAVAAIAAVGTIGSAGSGTAQAIPVLCPVIIDEVPAPDPIRIATIGYDLGSGGMDGNEPAGCGTLSWGAADDTFTPHLDATLYAKNAMGTDVRVRLRHYDVDGTLLATSNGARHEVGSNDVEEFDISLGQYSDPLIYRVDVEIQLWVDDDHWETIAGATESEYISSSDQAPDDVLIAEVGTDFGEGTLVANAPSDPGTLTWDLSDDTTRPTLQGTLFTKNSDGTELRMRMRHYDAFGNLLAEKYGAIHRPTGTALETFPIDLANYASPLIYRTEVEITVKVGNDWVGVGTPVTVFI
jgi:hypothetical protein